MAYYGKLLDCNGINLVDELIHDYEEMVRSAGLEPESHHVLVVVEELSRDFVFNQHGLMTEVVTVDQLVSLMQLKRVAYNVVIYADGIRDAKELNCIRSMVTSPCEIYVIASSSLSEIGRVMYRPDFQPYTRRKSAEEIRMLLEGRYLLDYRMMPLTITVDSVHENGGYSVEAFIADNFYAENGDFSQSVKTALMELLSAKDVRLSEQLAEQIFVYRGFSNIDALAFARLNDVNEWDHHCGRDISDLLTVDVHFGYYETVERVVRRLLDFSEHDHNMMFSHHSLKGWRFQNRMGSFLDVLKDAESRKFPVQWKEILVGLLFSSKEKDSLVSGLFPIFVDESKLRVSTTASFCIRIQDSKELSGVKGNVVTLPSLFNKYSDPRSLCDSEDFIKNIGKIRHWVIEGGGYEPTIMQSVHEIVYSQFEKDIQEVEMRKFFRTAWKFYFAMLDGDPCIADEKAFSYVLYWRGLYLAGTGDAFVYYPHWSRYQEKAIFSASNFCKRQYAQRYLDIYSCYGNYLDSIYLASKVREHSTKSAIGSIMSRNGSHNIGSHVLSALTHNVGTMPDDRVLYQYIQHRMDYIASATTDFPDWSVPTKFVGDLMKLFYSQRHLLEHIAGSEGLRAYEYQGRGLDSLQKQDNRIKVIVRRVIEDTGEKDNNRLNLSDGWVEFKFNPHKKLYIREFLRQAERPSNQKKVSDDDLKNDIVLAMPGGVLGQHAFYNIVENVIRNAAKHAWSHASKCERAQRNLEIYIDAKDVGEGDWVSFTVGDSMSKLFDDSLGFWRTFFEEVGSLIEDMDVKIDPEIDPKKWQEFTLNDNVVTAETVKKTFALALSYETKDEDRRRLSEYLEVVEDRKVEDLPPHYQILHRYIAKNWTENHKFSENKKFKAMLMGKDPGDGTLGCRLPLPLHHRQEMELAKPFIDLESNRLRQSSWGLAEMKISAGYLRRASLSEIGGLNQGAAQHPLIVPIGMPVGAFTGDSNALHDPLQLHLAYRFWISKPKSVAIVCDSPEKLTTWKTSFANSTAVGVFDHSDVKNKVGLLADYGFVLFDCASRSEEDLLLLPFRTVFVGGKGGSTKEFAQVERGDLRKCNKGDLLEKYVYRAWLNFLKQRRGREADSELSVKLNIYDKEGREQGLITDEDILRVLFRECFHSVVEPLVDDLDLKIVERIALLLLSLYPIKENDSLFVHGCEMSVCVGTIARRVLDYLKKFDVLSDGWTLDGLAKVYATGLGRSETTLLYPEMVPMARKVLEGSSDDALRQGVNEVLLAMSADAEDNVLVRRAVGSLEVAWTTSDVFLRKYEERIATLPDTYKVLFSKGGSGLPRFPDINVNLVGGDFVGQPDISYNRHNTDNALLYSEPISGSQSYLSALANIKGEDLGLAVRLAEAGLLRILIFDERVCDFILRRKEIMAPVYASMHISVADTRNCPWATDEDKGAKERNERREKDLVNQLIQYVAHASEDADYDVLIIHQGIIDKWWSRHSKEEVAEVLRKIRKSGIARFVVITTGRGRPDNIPDNEKVLPFSAIEAFLFRRYPEKMTLVNSVMNILPYEAERSLAND